MIYFGIALFCTGLFLAQFILSMVIGELGADTDVDLDADGIGDLNLSDLFSFKGLLHFGIGFSWTMWFTRDMPNKAASVAISVLIGVVFMIVLFLTYWLAGKLKNDPRQESGSDLVGRTAEIYLSEGPRDSGLVQYRVWVTINGSKRLMTVVSESDEILKLPPGTIVTIRDFHDGRYFI